MRWTRPCLFALLGFLLVIIGCGGGGSTPNPTPIPTVVISAPTLVTEADKGVASATDVAGGTYAWTIQNGTITGGGTTRTISYTVGTPGTTKLTVSVAGATASATMDVLPLPRIESFQAAASTISKGTSTQLTAVFSNGNGNLQPGNIPMVSGTPVTVAPTTDTIYTLNVTNAAGSNTAFAIQVRVVTSGITSFTAGKTTITVGSGTFLSYAFFGGTGSISPDVGIVTSGGTTNVSPTITTTYTITVTDPVGGTVTQTTTITVVPAAQITSFVAIPSTVVPGAGTTLYAVFQNGNGTLDNSLGTITSGGSGVSTGVLAATTTYTLTVTNPAGDPASAAITVTVTPFIPTGSMVSARHGHTATLLSNGKVLITGGINLASAELYDPITGIFTSSRSMVSARSGHTATLLPNGKVLITGGINLASAELYDPITGIFTSSGSMVSTRSGHTATLLPNGKVLIVGGYPHSSTSSTSPYSAELYDPTTGIFTATGSMVLGRHDHTATLLPNGKVLIAGGHTLMTYMGSSANIFASAELYDPTTEIFTATGSMALRRQYQTATLLPNGKVLIAGGNSYINATFTTPASAELYDPTTEIFTATGSMALGRQYHTATLLPNGKVLIAGGSSATYGEELYDPTTEIFTATGSMVSARERHTATLLPSGKVLIAGGWGFNLDLASAELFP